jgi:hypothetical protein
MIDTCKALLNFLDKNGMNKAASAFQEEMGIRKKKRFKKFDFCLIYF